MTATEARLQVQKNLFNERYNNLQSITQEISSAVSSNRLSIVRLSMPMLLDVATTKKLVDDGFSIDMAEKKIEYEGNMFNSVSGIYWNTSDGTIVFHQGYKDEL